MKKLLMLAVFFFVFHPSPSFALTVNFAELDPPKYSWFDWGGSPGSESA